MATTVELMDQAVRSHQAGAVEDAARLYRQVLEREPRHAQALRFMGMAALQTGRLGPAAQLLDRALAETADDAELHLMRGEVHRLAGESDAAAAAYRAALKHRPDYLEALGNLAALAQEAGELDEAVDLLRRAEGLAPAHPVALNNLGAALRAQGDNAAAAERFERAAAAMPDAAEVHVNLGRARLALGQAAPAAEALARALELTPDDAEALAALAGARALLGDWPAAADAFARAVALAPANAPAQAGLAQAELRLNRHDAARTAAGSALEREPENVIARLVLATLDRHAGEFERARPALEALSGSELPVATAIEVQTELGRACDRLDDADAAFAAFAAANRLSGALPAAQAVDRASYPAQIERLRGWTATLTPEDVAGWGAPADERTPVFFVGFPRSGTTLTEQVLAAHPALIGSDEAPFVGDLLRRLADLTGRTTPYPQVLGELDQNDAASLRDAYWAEVARHMGELGGRRLVDKLPPNLVHLALIRRLFPAAPVIVALRDPRDVVLSCFMQSFEPNPAMVQFLDLADAARLYDGVMALWRAGRDVLGQRELTVRYEDTVADLEATARTMFGFLGLAWTDEVLRYAEKASEKTISTPSYADVTRPIYDRAAGRWRKYREHLAPVLPVLAPHVAAFGYPED